MSGTPGVGAASEGWLPTRTPRTAGLEYTPKVKLAAQAGPNAGGCG
jgi:hypothetical protein